MLLRHRGNKCIIVVVVGVRVHFKFVEWELLCTSLSPQCIPFIFLSGVQANKLNNDAEDLSIAHRCHRRFEVGQREKDMESEKERKREKAGL